jgi:hypothetical protein
MRVNQHLTPHATQSEKTIFNISKSIISHLKNEMRVYMKVSIVVAKNKKETAVFW